MKYRVAVVQIEYVPQDKSASLEKMERFIDEAHAWGANVVCFQEYAVEGYPVKGSGEPIPGPTTERLAAKCRERGMYVVAGSLTEVDGDKTYNTVPFIGPQGEIIAKYRKVNLLNWPPKKEFDAGLSRGSRIEVVKTPLGNIGLLCGADLDPCEPCRILSLNECDVLFAPHSCTAEWVDAHRYVAQCRAWEGMFYVVAPNPCGVMSTPHGVFRYLGSSRILSPLGEIVASVGEFREGIAVAEVDLTLVRRLREENTWRLQRFAAYKPLVQGLDEY